MTKLFNKYSDIVQNSFFILILIAMLKTVVWLNNDIGFMKGSKYTLVAVAAIILILGIYGIRLFYSIYKLISNEIKNRTKKTDSEPLERHSNLNADNPKIETESKLRKRSTPQMKNKLFQLFPFAFDIALVILFSNLIMFFGNARDYYEDEILISFSTLFSLIILSKWYWSYKGKITGVTIKNYVFYLLLFSALLFGMFYISLLPE